GCHRGVDAAREAADHPPLRPRLRADGGDGLFAEGGHGPVAGTAADAVREVGDELGAVGRVHDLGVELDAVIAPGVVGHGGAGRPSEVPTTLKPSGRRTTRSPWLIQTWWRSPGCHSPSKSAQGSRISRKARPNS